jgi:enolase
MSKITWQQYDEKYGLAGTLSDAANSCFVAESNNPPAFLASYFRKKSSSDVLAAVSGTEVLDGAGGFSLMVTVALAGGASASSPVSHSSAVTPWHPSTARTAVLVGSPQDKKPRFHASAELIKSFSTALRGVSVTGQEAFDTKLRELDGTANFARLMSHVAACISVNAAKVAATSLGQRLHLHLAASYYPLGEQPRGFFIPTPIFTLFSTEPKNMGRVRVREVCLIPSKGHEFSALTLQKMTQMLDFVPTKLEELSTNADGAFKYNGYESLPQLVDFVEELLKEAGLAAGKDFSVGLVIDAGLCYKADTQKYSLVEGTDYTGAQVAEVLAQLTRDKKSVVYLEDTHHDGDVAEMRRLMSRVGTTVTIAGSNCYAGNVDAIRRGVKEMLTNNCVIRLNDCGTVTDAIKAARSFAEYLGSTLTVCGEAVEGNGQFLADFAVAIGARFVRVGGLCREQHAAIASRLLEIKKDLEMTETLQAPPELPAIATPPAPADVVVEVVAAKGAKKK